MKLGHPWSGETTCSKGRHLVMLRRKQKNAGHGLESFDRLLRAPRSGYLRTESERLKETKKRKSRGAGRVR